MKKRTTQTARKTLNVVVKAPRPTKATQVVNLVLYFLLGQNPLVDLAASAALIIFISEKSREGAHSLWFSVGIFCALAGLYLLIASQASKIMRRLDQWIGGPPAYGKDIGGLPQHLLDSALRASRDLKFSFTADDTRLMDRLAKLDQSLSHKVLGQRFLEHGETEGSGTKRQLTADWGRNWKTQVLGYRLGGRAETTADAWNAPSYAMLVVPHEFPRVVRLVLPLFYVYQTVLVYLVYRGVHKSHELLPVIQVGLAFSFVIAIVILLNSTQGLREIRMNTQVDVDALPEEFRDEARELVGMRLVPTRVAVGSGYHSAVRGFFARAVTLILSYNLLVQLTMLGLSLLGILLVTQGVPGGVLDWYGSFALGLLLIVVGIALGYLAMSYLVEFSRSLVGAVVAGVIGAIIPPLLLLIFTGHLQKGTTAILSSIATAVVTAIAAGVGARAKGRVSPD